ncbi:MAG: hypothetical protein AABW82_02280 [Nanoarchaeota archaeon]
MNKKILLVYASLIVFQLLHVLEELYGQAYFINTVYGGTINFLAIMLILLIIPIILLYLTYKKKKIAYFLSYGYAVIIIMDGIDHLITQVAGVYTSVGFIIGGIFLIYNLKNGA